MGGAEAHCHGTLSRGRARDQDRRSAFGYALEVCAW